MVSTTNLETDCNIVKPFSIISRVEEEEEVCTTVDAATVITADEVEAEDRITHVRNAQQIKAYAMLSEPACFTTATSLLQTK